MKNRKDVFDLLRESQLKKLQEIEEIEGFANKDAQDYQTLQPGGGVPGPENDTDVSADVPDTFDAPEEMPTGDETPVTGEQVLQEFDKIGTAFESLTSLGATFSGVLSVLMGYRKGLVTDNTINNMDTLKLVIDITERMVYMNSAVLALEKELGEFYSQRDDILKAFQINPEAGPETEEGKTTEEGEPETNPEQMKPAGTTVEGETRTESRKRSKRGNLIIEGFAVSTPEPSFTVKVTADSKDEAHQILNILRLRVGYDSLGDLQQEGDQWTVTISNVNAGNGAEASSSIRQLLDDEMYYLDQWDQINKGNLKHKPQLGEKKWSSKESGSDIVDSKGYQIGRVETEDDLRDCLFRYADEKKPKTGAFLYIDSDREDRPRVKMTWNGRAWVSDVHEERMFVPDTPAYAVMVYNVESDNEKEIQLVQASLKSVASVRIKGAISNKGGKFHLPVEVHVQTGSDDPTKEGYDIIRDAVKQAGNTQESASYRRVANALTEDENWKYHLGGNIPQLLDDLDDEAADQALVVGKIVSSLRAFQKAYPEVSDTSGVISVFADPSIADSQEDLDFALKNLYDWADDNSILIGESE